MRDSAFSSIRFSMPDQVRFFALSGHGKRRRQGPLLTLSGRSHAAKLGKNSVRLFATSGAMLAKLSVVTIITPGDSRRPAAATEDRHVGAQDTSSLCTQKRTNLVVAILTKRLLILGERSTSEAWPMSSDNLFGQVPAWLKCPTPNSLAGSANWVAGGLGFRTKTGGVRVRCPTVRRSPTICSDFSVGWVLQCLHLFYSLPRFVGVLF